MKEDYLNKLILYGDNRENAIDDFLFGRSDRPIIGRGYEKLLVKRVLDIIEAEHEKALRAIQREKE
jgi:hypothetical protein